MPNNQVRNLPACGDARADLRSTRGATVYCHLARLAQDGMDGGVRAMPLRSNDAHVSPSYAFVTCNATEVAFLLDAGQPQWRSRAALRAVLDGLLARGALSGRGGDELASLLAASGGGDEAETYTVALGVFVAGPSFSGAAAWEKAVYTASVHAEHGRAAAAAPASAPAARFLRELCGDVGEPLRVWAGAERRVLLPFGPPAVASGGARK